mmetsp:Transcript_25983/g.49015  ORF Transcript_25983/g.49015 Transcript_25983/m.49015 type:complete len:337 (+) Transcript_25983:41-1051(+)
MTTPVKARETNNYGAPNTPIASVKRPRQKPSSSTSTTPPTSNTSAPLSSPMHPATSRRLDADDTKENSEERTLAQKIFSPVLNFLGTEEDEDTSEPYQTPANEKMNPPVQQAVQHEEEEEEEELEEFNPYLFIKQLPRYESVRIEGKICLPPKTSPHRTTLVLDLDETLVHCTVDPVPNADMIFPVTFGGIEYSVHVRLRPGVLQFLDAVKDDFEVVVFTASQKVYADCLLDRLDPEGKFIEHRLFRDSCLPVEGNYLKDLTVLNRPLESMVLVDNSPHAFGYQPNNGIPIESWFDDPEDKELWKLERFLRRIKDVEDVRNIVREEFQTFRLIENA